MSVKNKLLLVLAGLIILSTIGQSWYFQKSADRSLRREFRRRGMLLANNLAYNAKLGILVGDTDNLIELINGVMQESGVLHALVYDDKGNIIATTGDRIRWSSLQVDPRRDRGKPLVRYGQNTATFIRPIVDDGASLGYAVVGMSLAELEKEIRETNVRAALITLVFVAAGILVLSFILQHFLGDLSRIHRFAGKLIDGRHGEHVSVSRNDEIGQLADSLNLLSDRIHESLQAAEENYRKASETAEMVEQHHQKALQEKRSLEASVKEILLVLDKIKTGDLTQPVVGQLEAEIAKVASGINLMLAEFSEVLSQLWKASQAVSEASGSISELGNRIAERTDIQFQNTDSMAAAVEELAATLENANQSMEQATEIAESAHRAAKDGGEIVHRAVTGINRIAEVVADSARTVQSLGEQSQQIKEIIEVIDEIADQTNLLALNAAIEAARAGEQGRGFAVVADEVRKLAERTSRATGEIAGVIQKILNLTAEAVQAMENGNNEMQQGKKLVEQVGGALGHIVEAVTSMQMQFERMVETSREQAMAASQISDQISMVRNVAKENAENAGMVRKAGQELENQLDELIGIVSRFKIGDPRELRRIAASVVRNSAQQAEAHPRPPYRGPERRKGDPPPGTIHPEGRRATDKGALVVGPNGEIEPTE